MENRVIKILTIDDNQDNLISLKALIKDAFPEASVLTALTGQKGLELARTEDPDVILLDILMPGMDGFAVCKMLKADQELKDIPVVFVTALRDQKENRIKALEAGGEAFLSKPMDESELTAQIRAMVKIREANIQKRDEKELLARLVEGKTRELVKSEAKYRQIAENVSDVVWTTDMDLRTTYISPSVVKMFGETSEAFMRKTIEETITPDSLERVRKALGEEFEKENDPKVDKNRSQLLEIGQYHADGSVIWASVHVSFLRDENGMVVGLQGTSRDVTEKKLNEEKISEQKKLLEKLPEQVPGAIFQYRYHPDGRNYFPYASSGIWDISEVTPDEIKEDASKLWSRLHPDDNKHVMEGILESIDTLENWKDEYRVILPKRGERWLGGTAKLEKLKDGSVLAHGFISDITDRKRMENQRDQNYQTLLEAQRIAHLGTWKLDLATNDVVWSEELYKMYGFDPTIPLPPYKEHMKLFTPESWDKLSTSLDRTSTSGIPYELELETVTKDGSNGWMWARGEAEKGSNGSIVSLRGVAQDITKRKKTEIELLYLSYHDHLTGLYNRRFFEEEIKRLDTKQNLPLSVIMCDVNGLKLVNDSFGHESGDTLLKRAAEAIRKACREGDVIARVGGDEFLVLLPGTTAEETVEIANRIKETTQTKEVTNIELSISYGYDTKTTDKQAMIEIIANAENHMYRHKLYERASLRSKTIDLIMNTLFEKSKREALHSSRVSSICQSIATKMDLDHNTVSQMRIAGLIHDIGKIGVSESILNKPGSLSIEERSDIERHPETGWRILSSTDELSDLAEYILNHHEKWDGSGYPNRLKGEAIQLEARIIAVADAYDAMTRERSYRKAMSKEDAIKELRRCSGTQFDPGVVDVFVNQVLPENSEFEGSVSYKSSVLLHP
jgi:diguanylate cyclase (GGDEF)-like protein/PAS domain S-box-containing protein